MGDTKVAIKVSLISVMLNVALAISKLIAGVVGKSSAMISDSVHSLSDVLSTFIVIIGIKIANKDSDNEHQFGHERMESVASVILSVFLFSVGASIGIAGFKKVISADKLDIDIPGLSALIVAVISIVAKEAMYWYTKINAKRINSGALLADAWHHRSDAFASIGGFVGILGARMGLPILDPIASMVICLFILKAAYDIFIDAVNKMVDKSCDNKVVEDMKEAILSVSGVEDLDVIRTRLFGSKIYVEIEISADKSLTLDMAHNIANDVHDLIERDFTLVKHCMVHVNPKDINHEVNQDINRDINQDINQDIHE